MAEWYLGLYITGHFQARKNTQDVIATPIAVLLSPNKPEPIDFSETSVVLPI